MGRLPLCIAVATALFMSPVSEALARPTERGRTVGVKRKRRPGVVRTHVEEPSPHPAPEPASPPGGAATPPQVATRGPTRLDFDDRLIQGQSNRAGAVYLYERKELPIDSMVKKRDSFRE